jgi:hypothetical protein
MKFLPIALLLVAGLIFSVAQAQPIKEVGPGMGKPGMGKPGMGKPGMGKPGVGKPDKYFDETDKEEISKSKRQVLAQIAKGNKRAAKRAIIASKANTTNLEEVEKVVDVLFDQILTEIIAKIEDTQLVNEIIESASMAIGGAVAELALQNGAAEEYVSIILSAGAFVAVDVAVEFADNMQYDEPPAAEAPALKIILTYSSAAPFCKASSATAPPIAIEALSIISFTNCVSSILAIISVRIWSNKTSTTFSTSSKLVVLAFDAMMALLAALLFPLAI